MDVDIHKEEVVDGYGSSNDEFVEKSQFSSSRQRGRARGRTRGEGNYSRPNCKRYDKSNIECYNCHKFGHYSWECQSATNDLEEKAILVVDAEPTLLLAAKENEELEENLWYLDNCARNYVRQQKQICRA